MTIAEIIAEYDQRMTDIGGCSNGFCCVTGKAKGQHTINVRKQSNVKMFDFPDLSWLIKLGMIALIVFAIQTIIAFGWLAYWLFTHVSISY